MKLFKNKRGSELVEKIIMVAFAVFMGGATIVYSAGIIKQSKKVEINSGFGTTAVRRNDVPYQSEDGSSSLKIPVIKFIRGITGLSLAECKKAIDNEVTFKYYFTESDFIFYEDDSERNVQYSGGFSTLYAQSNWGTVKELFDITISNNTGNILEYDGKEYDYSWNQKGQVVDKNSVEDSGTYSFTLYSYGSGRLKVVKAVREATGLGLAEAKNLVEATVNSPQVILQNASGNVIRTLYQAIDSGSPDAIYEIKTA